MFIIIYDIMNIEKILSKSVSKFKETITSISPIIILYTILSYIFTPNNLRNFQLDQNFETITSEIKTADVLFSLILILIFSLYTVFINQFIITNLKNKVFKISESISALSYMLLMYGLLLFSFTLLVLTFPIPDLVIFFILILYICMFFGLYIKIDVQKKNLDCILDGYFFCKHNFKNIFKIIIFHLLSIIVITYSIVILGFFASQIIGSFSIIFINILFYMASYFLSIAWIYAYFDLKQK